MHVFREAVTDHRELDTIGAELLEDCQSFLVELPEQSSFLTTTRVASGADESGIQAVAKRRADLSQGVRER